MFNDHVLARAILDRSVLQTTVILASRWSATGSESRRLETGEIGGFYLVARPSSPTALSLHSEAIASQAITGAILLPAWTAFIGLAADELSDLGRPSGQPSRKNGPQNVETGGEISRDEANF